MKPIIGLMPMWNDKRENMLMLPEYTDSILRAGGVPVIFPFLTEASDLKRLAGLCDGFLFTGGHDVSPELYSEKALDEHTVCCKKRDILEGVILEEALGANKPLLGICRGIQFINAKLGGTLYQDIPTQHPSGVAHNQRPPYDVPVHDVRVVKASPLHKLLKIDSLSVNSYHHQAVREIAPGLEVMAAAPDGLVEALYKPAHRFLWALQWHPEASYERDENSRKILGAFIDAAR